MPSTIKFSQFVAGGSLVAGDQVAGLRNNANTLFDWSGGGGSGAGASIEVTQANHGFTVGQALRLNGSVYALAQADSAENAEAVGLVTIADPLTPDVFTIQQIGPVSGLTNLVAGDVYFLSESSPGDLTTIEPSVSGEISKPMFIAATTTSGFILSMRGQVVTSVPDSPEVQVENILQRTINQNGHGLDLGHWVRLSGASYVKAIGTTQANAEVVGQVIEVIDVDNFVLQTAGYVSGSVAALTAGTVYYLSTTDLGEMTATEPTAVGEFTRPVFIATGATSGYILEQRSLEIESSGGGGGGEALTKTISQANTFVDPTDLGKLLRIDNVSGDYVFAQADSFVNSLVVGMLINIIDANTFVIQTAGYVPDTPAVVSTLNVGELYYLSPTALGGMTSTAPVTDGQVSRPVFMPDSADSGYLLEQRSLTLPFGSGTSGGTGSGNVVQAAVSTPLSVSAANITQLSISITPSSAASRIKLTLSGNGAYGGTSNLYIKRNGTIISEGGEDVGALWSTQTGSLKGYSVIYIDSPATASAITYDVYANSNFSINTPSSGKPPLIFIAEEIAAAGSGLSRNVVQTVITTADGVPPAGSNPKTNTTITPSSATSRIRITANIITTTENVILYKNGAPLTVSGLYVGDRSSSTGAAIWPGFKIEYIDSPATTSPITYSFGLPVYGMPISTLAGAYSYISTVSCEEIGPA